MVAPIYPYQMPNATATANANAGLPPSVATLAQTAADPMNALPAATIPAATTPAPDPFMNFTTPNVGVLNPPNKSDFPLSKDAFEEKDKLPSLPKPQKKGQTGLNLVFIGQILACAIGGFYLGKGIKGISSKLVKLLNR